MSMSEGECEGLSEMEKEDDSTYTLTVLFLPSKHLSLYDKKRKRPILRGTRNCVC